MPQAMNIEEAQAAVQALLNERVEVVNDLLQAASKSAQLRQQAEEAEAETARLYQAAIRQGWTAEELKRIGITDTLGTTAKPAKRRGSGRRTASSSSTTAAASSEHVG